MIYKHEKLYNNDGHWDGEVYCIKQTDDGQILENNHTFVDEDKKCEICEQIIE